MRRLVKFDGNFRQHGSTFPTAYLLPRCTVKRMVTTTWGGAVLCIPRNGCRAWIVQAGGVELMSGCQVTVDATTEPVVASPATASKLAARDDVTPRHWQERSGEILQAFAFEKLALPCEPLFSRPATVCMSLLLEAGRIGSNGTGGILDVPTSFKKTLAAVFPCSLSRL